jgi:hypothetical protein
MRHLLIAATAGVLFVSGAAVAQQSNQSYRSPNQAVQPQGPAQPNMLGSHPADGATSSGGSGVTGGSGQGGYTGTLPGGDPARSGQTVPQTTPTPPPRR